jgi:hypothetical protein
MRFLQQIQERTDPSAPGVLKRELFCEEEIDNIVDKFYSLYNQHRCNDGVVPKSMYQIMSYYPKEEWASTYAQVVQETKDTLFKTFDHEYQKLFRAIEKFHGRPTISIDEHNRPGFCLFNEMDQDYSFWHTDTYAQGSTASTVLEALNIHTSGYIQSYTVPLILGRNYSPGDTPGIKYDMNHSVEEIQRVEKLDASSKVKSYIPQMLYYDLGNVYTWKGSISHSVHYTSEISELWPRLTMQCFGWVTADQVMVFW